MRLVAGHCNTTDMAVGVDPVEAEPQWMIQTSKEHRIFFFSGSFIALVCGNPSNCIIAVAFHLRSKIHVLSLHRLIKAKVSLGEFESRFFKHKLEREVFVPAQDISKLSKIGRASCRERV